MKRHALIVFQGALGLAGALVSLLAITSHHAISAGSGPLFCDGSGVVNCTKVIGSAYGAVLGMPLGYFGLAFWLAVAAVTAFPFLVKLDKKLAAAVRLAIGSAGLAAALALAVISLGVLGALCQICEATQVLCLAYFITSLLAFLPLRHKPMPLPPLSGRLIAAGAGAAVLSLLPVIAGVILAVSAHHTPILTLASPEIAAMPRDVRYHELGLHSLGEAGAPVTVTVFTDFECSWCQKFHVALFRELAAAGKGTALFIMRNYPIKSHAHAQQLALAARCAGRAGKYWEYTGWLFETAKAHEGDAKALDGAFTRESLTSRARELGVDGAAFSACYDGQEELPAVKADMAAADARGFKGTPYVLINDRPYTGPWSIPGQLARDIRVAAGTEKPAPSGIVYHGDTARAALRRYVPLAGYFLGLADVYGKDTNDDGKPDQFSVSIPDYGIMAMILGDTDFDGVLDEFTWTLGYFDDPAKSILLYSETNRKDLVTRIWYGPGSIKLVAQDDLDRDGAFDSVVYYNETAKGKTQGEIVARFETDTKSDGRPHVWVYPERRIEFDADGDGLPDHYATDPKQMMANYNALVTKTRKAVLSGLPLAPGQSWALNPGLITEKRYQALVPRTFPGALP